MKKIVAILFFISLFIPQLKATHIVGGELNYRYLGNNDYEIRLTVYRDCYNGVPPFDDPAALGVFDSSNNLLGTLYMDFISLDTLPPVINSPCVIPPTDVCYEVTTYIDTVNLPPAPGGYQLAYQRCCRNYTILNIINPEATGATYYATIPDTTIEVVNSNPVFNEWPPAFLCSQVPFTFDHSATDYDGDSLYYELFQPFHGASDIDPMPQPPYNPPYSNIVWNPPYSTVDMLGGTDPLSIDPNTGLLTATPGPLGQFVIGIKVSEYRDGVFLSETKRDFQFNIVPCGNITVAALQAPDFSCESYTASFTNTSVGAGSYMWDFGDPTTANDTSTATTPTYTYPDTGTYVVSLIAFSGLNPACNDTSYGTVTIYPEFKLEMDYSNQVCTQDVEFTSSTLLDSVSDVIYMWDFGDPIILTDTSSLENPTYTYQDTGTYTATLIAYSPTNIGCNDTGQVTFTVYPEFTINAGYNSNDCSATFDFNGSSSFDGVYGVNYFWDFGDLSITNDTSSQSNPTYTYGNTGTFNPVLIAYSDNPACGDTNQLTLTVYPQFEFYHEIIEEQCSQTVEFKASSTLDGVLPTSYTINYGDGTSSNEPNSTHTYLSAGVYDVEFIVNVSNGCTETYTTTLAKNALAEIFVPNAFTPNNDSENDCLYVRGDFESMEFSIYDRWGEKMFETTDRSSCWDGTYKGELVDPGVFVYHLTVKCAGMEDVFKKGNVTVIR